MVLMKRTNTTAAIGFSILILLVGIFSIRGNLFGKTAATAFVLNEVEEDTGEEAVENSEKMDSELIAEVLENPRKVKPLPAEKIDSETLWLARVIYSETKRPEEMELVAWVVRNRVETKYRGKQTYQSAVLDPYQFSAFNPGDRKRTHYSGLTANSNAPGFSNAITIAHSVRNADANYRPFSQKTRHFYSEQSMVGVKHPNWAKGGKKVNPQRDYQVDERRFRFFAEVY